MSDDESLRMHRVRSRCPADGVIQALAEGGIAGSKAGNGDGTLSGGTCLTVTPSEVDEFHVEPR